MVKLLRLISPEFNSDVAECSFEIILNDGIKLKENARIALKNCNIPLSSYITIDNSNNAFTLKCKAQQAVAFNIQLVNGKYTLDTFISHFNQKIMNELTMDDVNTIGIQIQLAKEIVNNNSMASISYKRLKETPYANPFLLNVAINANIYNKTGGSVDPNVGNAFACDAGYLAIGAMYLRSQMTTVGSCTLGLTTNFNAAGNPLVNIDYYIIAKNNLYYYLNVDTEIEVASVIAPIIDDTLSIEINHGKLRYCVYNAAGDQTILFQHATTVFDMTENYRPIILLYDNIVRLGMPVYLKNPNFGISDDGSEIFKLPITHIVSNYTTPILPIQLGVMPVPGGTQGKFTLTFSKIELQRLLGFDSNILDSNLATNTFHGYIPIDSVIRAKNILIEILSLNQLSSWDSQIGTQRQRPLLAIIPSQLTYQQSAFVYNEVNPIFLDINNSTPILLRNMNIRAIIDIAGDDEETITISEQAEFTFILDG